MKPLQEQASAQCRLVGVNGEWAFVKMEAMKEGIFLFTPGAVLKLFFAGNPRPIIF